MKPTRGQLSTILLLSVVGVFTAAARPIEFSEVSLLVRSHESNSNILQEVRTRRLLRPLTAPQEDLLKSQGASNELVSDLRDNRTTLSPSEANALAASEQQAARTRRAPASNRDDDTSAAENVRVVTVSFGHPINLSQWGGADYEVTFQCRRYAGEDIVEPFLGDSVRNSVDTSTYLGQGRPDDSTTIFDRRNYRSVIAHHSSRPVSIDAANPVSIKGVPYLLYPIYGAGGVSLYYIGKSGDSVRLAVVIEKA